MNARLRTIFVLPRVRNVASGTLRYHQHIANLCGGLNSLVFAAALIIAGWWSWHLYGTLLQPQNAAAEYTRKRAELTGLQITNSKASEELRRVIGQVSLGVKPLQNISASECYTQVTATISNTGNREILLAFDHGFPLRAATVSIDEGGNYAYTPARQLAVHGYNQQRTEIADISQADLLPGESSSYPFLLRLERNKLYMFEFSVPVRAVASPITPNEPTRKTGWYWTARTFAVACQREPR